MIEKHFSLKYIFCALLLILVTRESEAQLVEKPIFILKTADKNQSSFRTQAEVDTIDLPFWNDFSSIDGALDTDWWVNSIGVLVNNDFAVQAPTVNVATLDGTRADGTPYSNDELRNGAGDSLLSCAIDLAKVPFVNRETVYLSFFWQWSGKGDPPDDNDSLRVQFKRNDGLWISQWAQAGDPNLEGSTFQQVILKVEGTDFFHEGFQFKFQSFNRLSGPFDTWNIDYVFLNQYRDAGDLDHDDLAASTFESTIFDTYRAMPYNQFLADQESILQPAEVLASNLSGRQKTNTFKYVVKNIGTGVPVETFDISVPTFNEFAVNTSGEPDPTNYVTGADSLYLSLEYYQETNEGFLKDIIIPNVDSVVYENIDLKINDTIRTSLTLHDYYAYDDGSAESGVGISQNTGRIAYQFGLEESDTITHIDMFFPAIANGANGQAISVEIWDFLSENETGLLHTSDEIIIENEWLRFNVVPALVVTDTFYIGYQQRTGDFLPVGLDKNTNSGSRIFFNVTGMWERNDEIEGSMLMRPVFENAAVITGTEPEITKEIIQIFPNPSNGIIHTSGQFDEIMVFDLVGKSIDKRLIVRDNRSVDLSVLQKGIYIVNFVKDNLVVHTEKVILR